MLGSPHEAIRLRFPHCSIGTPQPRWEAEP
jgi:hypothetical protein